MASIFSKNFYGHKQGSDENSDSLLSNNDIDISSYEDSDEFVPTDRDETNEETDNNSNDDLIHPMKMLHQRLPTHLQIHGECNWTKPTYFSIYRKLFN